MSIEGSTVSQVFIPANSCLGWAPCVHRDCKIILEDEREITGLLSAIEINTLISGLPLEKVNSLMDASHFYRWGKICEGTAGINIILKNIFHKTISENK